MLIRRTINIVVILTFFVLLLLNIGIIFEDFEDEKIIYAAIVLLIPLFFLFRELRLYYFRSQILPLNLNYSIIILMVILAGISYYLYSLFNITNIPAFRSFYMLSTILFPLIGLISADQYIFVRKKYIVFNIDRRLKIKKESFESLEIENRLLVIHFAGKEKQLRLGKNVEKHPSLIAEINDLIEKCAS